jgi:hypothetical protein
MKDTTLKHTKYFLDVRTRPDRLMIRDEWIERAIRQPVKETIQADGRIRRWARISEMDGKFLRVNSCQTVKRCIMRFSTVRSRYESEIL